MSGLVRRLSIFIGSSTEQLPVANAIQETLDCEYEPTVWSQDIFKPSSFALSDLVRATRCYDFATKPILVLWPHFFTLLAPPNQADEWWETRTPKLAELYARWSSGGQG